MANRVVVTGIGLVTPLGVGAKAVWKNLIASKSGLVSTSILSDYESLGWDKIPSKVIGKVPSGSIADNCWDCDDHFDKSESRRLALFAQYGMASAKEALDDAKLLNDKGELECNKKKAGVAIGSGIGSFHDIYDNSVNYSKSGYRKVQPLFIPKLLTNMAAGNISIKYGLQGPLHSVSTACATGLHSIGDAFNFIKNDYADVMVCGGTESSIHPLALSGFARARSVVTDFNDNPQEASRPFDSNRNGFVLSEGSGVVVLERLEHALARGLTEKDIYAEVLGYGLSGDAHHITAPLEDGLGAYNSMKMSITRSKLHPSDIDYINAHATSTVIGDRAENNAINRLIGDSETSKLNISSTKSSIGHLLGAAGAVESIFTIKAISESVIPPTLNLNEIGKHEDDDATKFGRFDYVPNVAKATDVNYALCNSFGFGGVNATLCFGKY